MTSRGGVGGGVERMSVYQALSLPATSAAAFYKVGDRHPGQGTDMGRENRQGVSVS